MSLHLAMLSVAACHMRARRLTDTAHRLLPTARPKNIFSRNPVFPYLVRPEPSVFCSCPHVQMKVKMDDMAQEFGDMLKETLDRMRERIEASESRFLVHAHILIMTHTVGTCGSRHGQGPTLAAAIFTSYMAAGSILYMRSKSFRRG